MPQRRIALAPPTAFSLDLRVPGSKSLTNRALLVAALADGESVLQGALVAEDAEVMRTALVRLGARIEERGADPAGAMLAVRGVAGRWPVAGAELDVRLSGTAVRFLTAAVCLGRGRFRLDGTERMRERPIEDQLEALRALGVDARSEHGSGCPPVVVEADGLPGGTVGVSGDRSSQYLSGLLLAAPYARAPLTVEVGGVLQSKPFVDVTLAVMRAFGAEVERDGYRTFHVPTGAYRARTYRVEGDAMAAGYFWAAAALSGGRATTRGLGRASVQGDMALLDVLARMGCTVERDDDAVHVTGPAHGRLRGGRFDLNAFPDQAQTLAVLALGAREPVHIDDVWNLRIKETDRLSALATELQRLGARVEERRDGLSVWPLDGAPRPSVVATYGDHRMAMAFALAGVRWPGIVIDDPGCVAKTYPGFWTDLARAGVGTEAVA
jgi:3-phosphoshikimate 1-carboxyvinyltransferase